MVKFYRLIFFTVLSFSIFSCKRDEPIINLAESEYPSEVGKIILTKCAVSGCHNAASKEAASGLNLESWQTMMQGGRNGAVAIPFSHKMSTLFLFTNTYQDLGVSVYPTMPISAEKLSREEINLLQNWLDSGAPNANGFVKFSDNNQRKKYYVTNQACDLVAVVDQQTGLIMRYIQVGVKNEIEGPHMVKVSNDGKYWMVCFINSNVFQVFDAAADALISSITIDSISQGNWNTFALSDDNKYAFVVDWSANGKVAVVDLQTFTNPITYRGNNLFVFPHGSAYRNNTLYVTGQTGNFIYKINVSDILSPEIEEMSLEPGVPITFSSKLDAHEIAFNPAGDKYFVTCQKSNEIRVFSTQNDNLLSIIQLNEYPQEMSFSNSKPYLFVSCTEDRKTFPGVIGSVAVINYETLSLVKYIDTGFQPHGIAVDDAKSKVYVAHRNVVSEGPAPHHTSDCGGRNGYVTAIDMNTLERIPGSKFEVAPDPYSVSIRK